MTVLVGGNGIDRPEVRFDFNLERFWHSTEKNQFSTSRIPNPIGVDCCGNKKGCLWFQRKATTGTAFINRPT